MNRIFVQSYALHHFYRIYKMRHDLHDVRYRRSLLNRLFVQAHLNYTLPAFANARRTSVWASGTLYAFFSSGRASASAILPASASTSRVKFFPVRNFSAAGTRQGIGATPPRTMRASFTV